jgi:hypothetical protein
MTRAGRGGASDGKPGQSSDANWQRETLRILKDAVQAPGGEEFRAVHWTPIL